MNQKFLEHTNFEFQVSMRHQSYTLGASQGVSDILGWSLHQTHPKAYRSCPSLSGDFHGGLWLGRKFSGFQLGPWLNSHQLIIICKCDCIMDLMLTRRLAFIHCQSRYHLLKIYHLFFAFLLPGAKRAASDRQWKMIYNQVLQYNFVASWFLRKSFFSAQPRPGTSKRFRVLKVCAWGKQNDIPARSRPKKNKLCGKVQIAASAWRGEREGPPQKDPLQGSLWSLASLAVGA